MRIYTKDRTCNCFSILSVLLILWGKEFLTRLGWQQNPRNAHLVLVRIVILYISLFCFWWPSHDSTPSDKGIPWWPIEKSCHSKHVKCGVVCLTYLSTLVLDSRRFQNFWYLLSSFILSRYFNDDSDDVQNTSTVNISDIERMFGK